MGNIQAKFFASPALTELGSARPPWLWPSPGWRIWSSPNKSIFPTSMGNFQVKFLQAQPKRLVKVWTKRCDKIGVTVSITWPKTQKQSALYGLGLISTLRTLDLKSPLHAFGLKSENTKHLTKLSYQSTRLNLKNFSNPPKPQKYDPYSSPCHIPSRIV